MEGTRAASASHHGGNLDPLPEIPKFCATPAPAYTPWGAFSSGSGAIKNKDEAEPRTWFWTKGCAGLDPWSLARTPRGSTSNLKKGVTATRQDRDIFAEVAELTPAPDAAKHLPAPPCGPGEEPASKSCEPNLSGERMTFCATSAAEGHS